MSLNRNTADEQQVQRHLAQQNTQVMSGPNLLGIPPELFDMIGECLEVVDVCTLRLVSRSTSRKAMKIKHFIASLKDIRLELSRSKLESLAKLTGNFELVQHVQNLTIVGRAYATRSSKELQADRAKLLAYNGQWADDILLQQDGLDVEWLTESFSNLALRVRGEIKSLSIVIGVYVNTTKEAITPSDAYDSGANIARACAQTFSCVVQALARTNLSTQSLDVFYSGPAGQSSGLLSKSLNPIDWTYPTANAFRSLRCLSMRVLEKASSMPHSVELYEVWRHEIRDSVSITGLVVFLQACSGLQELQLSMYWDWIRDDRSLPNDPDAAIQNPLHRRGIDCLLSVKLPRLQIWDLAGFDFGLEKFHSFLDNHSATLRGLRLSHMMFLAPGDISRMFSFLSSDTFDLNSIKLADLRDRSPIIFLGEEQQEFARISSAWYSRSAIQQWDNGTKQTIPFTRIDRAAANWTGRSYARSLNSEFGNIPWVARWEL